MAINNARILGHGVKTLEAGKIDRIKSKNQGQPRAQFTVTNITARDAAKQNDAGTLERILAICDSSGNEAVPCFPFIPVPFETDAEFVVKNNSQVTLTYYVGEIILLGNARPAGRAGSGASGSSGSSGSSSSSSGSSTPTGGSGSSYSSGQRRYYEP